jgi:ribosomal protein L21E
VRNDPQLKYIHIRIFLITYFKPGDRVRIDIPDEADPDHERYHGREGTVMELLADDASEETGDSRDATIYRVELGDGLTVDMRWRDLRPPLTD